MDKQHKKRYKDFDRINKHNNNKPQQKRTMGLEKLATRWLYVQSIETKQECSRK